MSGREVPEDDDRIYISDLARIVNRKRGTIRKWESSGRLPKKLIPARGFRGWRCWTHQQVYGRNGIIAWMRKNDMRPGNKLSKPGNEDSHVEKLRQPKMLSGHNIMSARMMAEAGRSREHIIKNVLPRTRYYERVERMLEVIFEDRGWYLPPAKPRKHVDPPLSKQQRKDLAKMEKMIRALDQ